MSKGEQKESKRRVKVLNLEGGFIMHDLLFKFKHHLLKFEIDNKGVASVEVILILVDIYTYIYNVFNVFNVLNVFNVDE